MKGPNDQPIRDSVLNVEESFIVQAPAGSGKTELLTQRILALLAVCDAPENILAMTFTIKAAAEMRARVIGSLNQARTVDLSTLSGNELKTATLAKNALTNNDKRGWSLLEDPNRLQIMTIDALCSSIAQRAPLIEQFGSKPEVEQNPRALYEEAALSVIRKLDEKDSVGEAIQVFLRHVDNNYQVAMTVLADLLGERTDWLPVLFQAINQPDLRSHLNAQLNQTILAEVTTLRSQIDEEG